MRRTALLALICFNLLATVLPGSLAHSRDLASVLHWSSPFWDSTPSEVASLLDCGRLPKTRGITRLPRNAALHFETLPLPAPVLIWHDGRLSRLESTLYHHDRQGTVSEGWLLEQYAAATGTVSRWAGSAPISMTRRDGTHALVWGRSPHIVSLEWSPGEPSAPTVSTRVVRLIAEPWPPRRDFAANLVQTSDGDIYLPVPMVDQKQQGLCAPATVERVMRHYGIPIGAGALAQLAESAPETGTNVQMMLGKLTRLRGLRCNIREILGFDLQRFERLLAEYNRQAEEKGLATLSYDPPLLDLARVFAAASPEILRPAALSITGKRLFWREIKRSVDRGHPLLWGVILGIVSEKGMPSRTNGGHLRLVIGYNDRTEEVLYSDSWGPEHSLKRMSAEDARTMTMTLHVIAPP